MTSEPWAAGEFELLTGPGPAAIAVIRIRGLGAERFVQQHIRTRRGELASWPVGRVGRAELLDGSGAAIDDILLSLHSGPPLWDLRLHLHGNPDLVEQCTEFLRACRLEASREEPRDLWPTDDPVEAEAWTLLPRLPTRRGAYWLLGQVGRLRAAIGSLLECDRPELVSRTCRQIAAGLAIVDWFEHPLRVVLAGPPNAGKSTLANALADRRVSVVSPVPGTTRDWVEARGEVEGFPIIWLDTAGLGRSRDALEGAGIEQTHRVIRQADGVVIVLDVTDAGSATLREFLAGYGELAAACVALNKCDLPGLPDALRGLLPPAWRAITVEISAARRWGLEPLCNGVLTALGRTSAALAQPAAFTPRQAELLTQAAAETDLQAMHRRLTQVLSGRAVFR